VREEKRPGAEGGTHEGYGVRRVVTAESTESAAVRRKARTEPRGSEAAAAAAGHARGGAPGIEEACVVRWISGK
jgi:hypothetical protein